jgi:hypothetical protein
VAKILDNLKNNVDTTLYEIPALSAPDMTQKSGVAQHSAGTPKLSMRSDAPVAAPSPAPAPAPAPVEFAPVIDEDPFDTGGIAVQVDEEEEDPFAHMAAPDDFEDPFDNTIAVRQQAPVITAVPSEQSELQELLANTRALVATLETALERARENERMLVARLGR